MSDTPAPPPAGWYPDPLDDGAWRWWDGTTWTTEVRVPEAADPEPAAPDPSTTELGTPGTDEQDDAEAETPAVDPEPEPEPEPEPAWLPIDHRYVTYADAAEPSATDGAKANTPWAWILAFAPYLMAIVAGTVQGFGVPLLIDIGVEPLLAGAATLAAGLLVPWILGGLDVGALRRRGFQPPSILWMFLLPPMAYFIARGARLRKQGARSRGPAITFWIVLATFIGTAVAGALFAGAILASFVNGGLL